MSASYARTLAVSVWVAFLGYFLYRFGAANIWLDLKMIGWRLSAIVALEALMRLTSARAGWYMFPSKTRQGCFTRIWLVQLAGNALNDITPGVPLGGEPIKAMLKEQFDLPVTTATLLSAKLAQALAGALFIILGVVAVSWSLKFEYLPAKSLAAGFIPDNLGDSNSHGTPDSRCVRTSEKGFPSAVSSTESGRVGRPRAGARRPILI